MKKLKECMEKKLQITCDKLLNSFINISRMLNQTKIYFYGLFPFTPIIYHHSKQKQFKIFNHKEQRCKQLVEGLVSAASKSAIGMSPQSLIPQKFFFAQCDRCPGYEVGVCCSECTPCRRYSNLVLRPPPPPPPPSLKMTP